MKESFVFYRSFYEAIKDLKIKDKLQVYEAICELSLNQKELKLTGMPATIFKLIKPQILANYERYENGKKGGAPIGNQNARKTTKNNQWSFSKTTKKQPNENVNENDNVNVNENENVRETTPSPSHTLSEIISYGSSLGITQEYCERFFDYYEGIGWINGNGLPIKNWKLVLTNWYKKDLENGKIKKQDISRRLG